MRTLIYTLALPVLAVAGALAQGTQPQNPSQPQPQTPASAGSTATDTKTDSNAKSDTKGMNKNSDRMTPEVKTETYAGTLMDASCAASGSAAAAEPSGAGASEKTTPSAARKDSANRSADAGSCSVSSNTAAFAIKTKDGKVLRFDDVGNNRVKEGMKTHKSWSDSASSSKPIKVKARGLVSGDKLIVLSVN
jgi:hypothetical protein